MKTAYLFYITSAALYVTACSPEKKSEGGLFEPEASDDPVEKETVADVEEMAPYTVLSNPWNEYFRSAPSVYIVSQPSKGVRTLLQQEQKLIKSVLDATNSTSKTAEYGELEDRLSELKTLIPASETASGYVEGSRRGYYGTYSYSGFGYAVIGRRYYGSSYTVFKQKEASSSPALTRSVQGIAHNATLEDIDQRIDALQKTLTQWNRKTSEMSPNGTEGIMRKANEEYLDGLKEYTNEFIALRAGLRKIEQQQAAIAQKKSAILKEWSHFENTRLPILDDFISQNTILKVELPEDGVIKLPKNIEDTIIFACTIGPRTLYFDLSTERNRLHPFVLLNLTPQNP